MRNSKPRILLRILVATLGMVIPASSYVLADDISARVLAHYPTRGELQQRIEHAKTSNLIAFQVAQRDFGEAIRLSRSVKGPPWPGKRSAGIPIRPRKLTLYALKTRADWESDFQMTDESSPQSEWVEFYRKHLDELTVDENSPMLTEVLIDVVLNGWHDWTHWDDPKLVALRKKFPELHRVYAIRELRRLKVEDIGGVLLEQLIQPDLAPELLFPVSVGVDDLVKPEDAFEFVLDIYLRSNAPLIRTRMEKSLPGASDRAGKGERVRQDWRPYLESEVPLLRLEARRAFGLPVPDRFTCNDLQERWVAENDADPGRRETARRHVRNRELRLGISREQGRQVP